MTNISMHYLQLQLGLNALTKRYTTEVDNNIEKMKSFKLT